MSEIEFDIKNDLNNKKLISFNTSDNFYKDKLRENKSHNIIMEYSYPLCIFKIIKKESEEMKKIHYRLIYSKKEKILKEKPMGFKKINNNNFKRNLSTKTLNTNKVKKLAFKNNKKLIRSKSNPIYPYCKQDNNLHKRDYLSQIEKRGNYYNKKIIATLQRQALNKISSSPFKTNSNEMNKNNFNFVLNNINNKNIIEESEKNILPEVRQFLNNRIIVVNEKKTGIDDYFNIDKKQNLPKITKKNIKYNTFHNKKNTKKELKKPYERELKMTKTKLRDLKVMACINKIRDPDIIKKYKTLIYNN